MKARIILKLTLSVGIFLLSGCSDSRDSTPIEQEKQASIDTNKLPKLEEKIESILEKRNFFMPEFRPKFTPTEFVEALNSSLADDKKNNTYSSLVKSKKRKNLYEIYRRNIDTPIRIVTNDDGEVTDIVVFARISKKDKQERNFAFEAARYDIAAVTTYILNAMEGDKEVFHMQHPAFDYISLNPESSFEYNEFFLTFLLSNDNDDSATIAYHIGPNRVYNTSIYIDKVRTLMPLYATDDF